MRFFSLVLFLSVFAYAQAPSRWSDLGQRPLKIDLYDHEHYSAKSCRDCHSEVYSDWSKSRHAVAWSNEIFQEGYIVEKRDRCLHCHAPMQKQFDAIKDGKDQSLANEGVNCTVCHVRDGQMIGAKTESYRWHPVAKDESLKSPKFCASCHQFNIDAQVNGQDVATDVVAQNTFREWEDYQSKGGTKTCQQCHMPQGRHLFHGAHNDKMLTSSVRLNWKKSDSKIIFEIQSIGIGHNLPTGDVFRNLTLEVKKPSEKNYRVIARFGRTFGLKIDPETLGLSQEMKADTALRPFEKRLVESDLKAPLHYRLRYHFVSDRDKQRSQLAPSSWEKTIVSGPVP